MRTFSKLANGAVIGLIVANAIGLAAFFVLRHRVGLYRLHSSIPAPSGYLADAAKMRGAAAPCYLIRLSADGCHYCREDQPWYRGLLARARRSGCEAVVMAPKTGQLKWDPARGGPIQLQYVDMGFGRALVPYTVPQTILLDSKHKIAWYRVGAMNGQSLRTALAALGKLGLPDQRRQ